MHDVTIQPWRITRTSAVDAFSETIFSIGNGTLGVRGYGAWAVKPSPQAHAVFRAGLFSYIKPGITDMVQLPDVLTLCPVGEVPDTVTQILAMDTGVLTHTWQTPRATVCMERTVSMADTQLMLQRLTLTAKQAGLYTVQAIADATVRNLPVHDDQTIAATEMVQLLDTESITYDSMTLRTASEGSPVRLLWTLHSTPKATHADTVTDTAATSTYTCTLAAGEMWVMEKQVRILVEDEEANPTAADPWAQSAAVWAERFAQCDIQIDADDPDLQGALRYNIFQMLCNNAGYDRRVSIGARGLSHGRYKGNTFWDTEIFLLPFYLWTRPDAAKNLLYYRADRLEDARALAKKQNLDGARFPWMCAGTGQEQCESWDIGLCEVHITADVAYAMQRYADVTGDETFRREVADEVFAETARYWLSRLTYEPSKNQVSSFFVKGPDEYCGATVNNTFTNYLARYNMELALQGNHLIPEERARMTFARDRIAILYDAQRDLFLQDELLDRLEVPPFLKSGEEPSYKTVCFDRMQRYRALKQADLVLLMTLFPDDFTLAQKANVFAYYEPITLHDSTLSYGAHAQLALRLGLWSKAETYLRKAIYLDLEDVMGNTGHEGVHMAALGAAWQAVVFGALGLWSQEGKLTLTPMLPPGIHRIRMPLCHHGKHYVAEATNTGSTLEEVE